MLTFKHPKAQKVLGFLYAKGFLYVRNMKKRHVEKIHVNDALWVGEHIEPRVLEVLPAAILHYPRTFLFIDQLPIDFKTIIKNIEMGKKTGPNYKGIEYKKMYHWADMDLNDGRTEKQTEKKVNFTIRIKRQHTDKLRKIAESKNETMTSIIESWIENAH